MSPPGVTLFLCGDVMTGRGVDQILEHPGDPRLYESWAGSALEYVRLAERKNGSIPRGVDPAYIWGDALAVLNAAGTTARIINLETAVTDGGEPWPGKGIHYRMDPHNVACITSAGIDCCVLANNHVLDWSYPGLEQTLNSLEGAGLGVTGAGSDATAATRPALIDIKPGCRVVVVALGTPSSGIPPTWAAGSDRPGVALARGLSSTEVDAVAARVASAATAGDLVVVSIHWGPNWGYDIPSSHRRFARALIDRAGVHVVHGHSSHHPLGIEVYRDRPILYGCGDLINDYEGIRGHAKYHPDLGLLYLVTMDPAAGRLQQLELVPVRIHQFRLAMASTEERTWLQKTLTREGESTGTVIEATESGRLFVRW
jgi:poly-gamma-glutamate synthesis protein (capsule biosynthesis protein)